jgi:catechol 2,3-dioxygenase-like lactoylglutathione lyase family enzyme
MTFAHICINVSDMEEALKLWRDILGFKVYVRENIPDGDGPQNYFDQKTLDEIFHFKGAKSEMVILVSDEGAMIELEQPSVPQIKKTPREQRQYGYTGISEIALNVKGIEDWHQKIKSAGYELQTPYVWEVKPSNAKSFLFYDSDGNMIQFYEAV